MSTYHQALDPEPAPRKPLSLPARVMVVAATLTLVAVGMLVVLRDEGDAAPPAVPIPAPHYSLVVAAAESCPMLTTPRLAAQIMANSGFDPSASIDGREGIAGLTDQAWQRWSPWPDADRADPDANITALARQMCDFAGQLRLAGTPGEPWHLALAAHRTTLDDVVFTRGVPAVANAYVAQVNGYEQVYRDSTGSSDPPATLPAVTLTAPSYPAVSSPSASPSPNPTPPPSPISEPAASQTTTRPTTAHPNTARPPTQPGSTRPTSTRPAPATTTTPPITGPTGPITGYLGKCVHVAYTNSADNAQIELYPCNGGPAEMMTMASDGTIRALGKCVDIKDGSTSNGARIVLFACNGSPSQQWVFTAGRDIVNPRANKCLDVLDALTYDGVPLQIWECNGGAHQKWWVPA